MMPIRNIKGSIPDASGEVYKGPITFTPENIPNSVVQRVITVEPDTDGAFDFNLHSGTYKATFAGATKVAKVLPVGPSSLQDIFPSNEDPISKSEYDSLKDLVSFCLSNRLLLGDDGKLYSLSVVGGKVRAEVYEK